MEGFRYDRIGGMGEWLKPAVLKTVELERVPGVRIPLPPPSKFFISKVSERKSHVQFVPNIRGASMEGIESITDSRVISLSSSGK
jgi:hypothetical protein